MSKTRKKDSSFRVPPSVRSKPVPKERFKKSFEVEEDEDELPAFYIDGDDDGTDSKGTDPKD